MDVAVAPSQAYDAISDVGRMATWSPELDKTRPPRADGLKVGDDFGGTNKRGWRSWRTVSTVVEAERPKSFVFESHFMKLPIARWGYTIESTSKGARVTESWTDLRVGLKGKIMWTLGLIATGIPQRKDVVADDMRSTLAAMKKDLESN